MPSQGPRAKHWCFTLNNYTDNDLDRLATPIPGVGYLIFGREVSSTGTPHLQGTVCFLSRKRRPQVITTIGKSRCTVARSLFQSIEYCKKDGDFVEVGAPSPSTIRVRSQPFALIKKISMFWDVLASGIVSLIKSDPNEHPVTDFRLPPKQFERTLGNR